MSAPGPRPRDRGDVIMLEGAVVDLVHGLARVRTELGGRPHFVLAAICGKMRTARVRVMVGDRVSVEVSAYDTARGRITFRHR